MVPFLDVPKGMSAELTISRSSAYGNVLGLRIVMNAKEDYYLDGTFRNEAECTLRPYSNPDGGLANFGFMTNLETAPAPGSSWAYLTNASFNQGLLYNIDLEDLESSTMRACGYKNGQLTQWDAPIVLDGAAPSLGELESLANRLKDRYANLRQHYDK